MFSPSAMWEAMNIHYNDYEKEKDLKTGEIRAVLTYGSDKKIPRGSEKSVELRKEGGNFQVAVFSSNNFANENILYYWKIRNSISADEYQNIIKSLGKEC